ncbi:amino acid adenylation domain-containing protein [Streptomyces misionensis]|uniref:amino acid adenylation domain-containing protein n=1 Tax=Streptomyces misionensis TaxID=67331 RepID=UPI00367C5EFC
MSAPTPQPYDADDSPYDDEPGDRAWVAVTGMACRFPGADSTTEFWDLLREGRSPLERVTREELRRLRPEAADDPSYVALRKPFADPSLFDAGFFGLTPGEAAATDPQQRFLLELAVHALEDAGLDPAAPPAGVGVYLGMNHSDYLLRHVLGHPEVIRRLGWHRTLMGNDRGFTATTLSYRLGLTGPSVAVDCACSSSLAAVHQACRALLNFDTDVALAGGAAIRPHDVGYPYTEGGIASPDGSCHPFSARAKGTVFASGAGLVVLRRLEDALAEGDRILAVVRASDMNNDGAAKSGYTAPSAQGQEAVVAATHRLAGITADQVSYVEAHGTGTPLGDPIEVAALTAAFGQSGAAAGDCVLGSVKANIGHLDSASGIAGLIKVVLALRHRTLPATPGGGPLNPHIDFASTPFRVNREPRPWTAPGPLLAGVSSFGVGGTNVHLLVQEAPAAPGEPEPADAGCRLLAFSARSADSLDALEQTVRERACGQAPEAVTDLAHTLLRSRTGHPLRRALLWRTVGELVVLTGADQPLNGRPPVFVLRRASDSAPLDQDTLDTLLSTRPAFREAARRTVGAWAAARGQSADRALASLLAEAPALVVDTVVALGCAAVWTEHGVRPGAVVADARFWLAAAVLTGALPAEQAPALLAGPVTDRVGGLPRPARIAWYDPDGSEWCAAGTRPDLAAAASGAAPVPGRRRLPPKASVALAVLPGPVPDAWVPRIFEGAVPVAFPGLPVHEALSAALGRAWALGLDVDPGAVTPSDAGRLVDLPGYPFTRQRHWLDAAEPLPRPIAAGRPERPDAAEDREESARRIFAEALGVADVTARDNLFLLGGDSLLATRIVAEARSRWERAVPVGSFLSDPTPATLARLAGGTPGDARPAAASPAGATLPVTGLQERFLFLSEFAGAAESYNVPVLADLRGALDVTALRDALRDVVRRHESLRAVFRTSAGEPVQEILTEVPCELPVTEPADEAALRREITALLDRTIPVDRPPLFRAALLRTAPDRHVLVLVLHHIVADASSTGILLRDLYACYARRTGAAGPDLPPVGGLLGAELSERTRWLASAEADGQLRFWLDELNELPERLELPADRPRDTRTRHRGDKIDFALSAERSARITELAARTETSAFTVVLAAFAVVLARVAGRDDFVIGVPVSGRHRPRTRDLIGNFVNTLPLRIRVDRERSLTELLGRLASRMTAALDHQDLPFEVLAEKLRARGGAADAPLFDVLFNMLSPTASVAEPPAGLRALPVPFERATSPYELSLDWWFDRDGILAGRFVYDTDRFDRETVMVWRELFEHVLDAVLGDPESPLTRTAADPPGAAAQVTALMSGPVVAVPELPVHAVFARHAAETPARLAVRDGGLSLTYGELGRISAALAGRLTARGVTAGDSVGIAMPRGVPLVAALLGVLRAGATPVPLDPALPRRRLAAIAEDCRPRLVLCANAADAEFAAGAEAMPVPALTTLADEGPDGPVPGDRVSLDAGAYLTYTSGTTGRPKGIHFPHRALANLVHWETNGHTAGLRWLQLASFGFDAAFHETFAALCSGGSLFVADEDTKHDHDLLAAFLHRHRVEKAILPVSLLHALTARFAADTERFAALREIASTGEQLRVSEPLLAFFERLPDCRLINNYGPAETHVVTSYRFAGPPRSWPRHAPIGRPIQNVVLRIQDVHGGAVPRGSVGNLIIGGDCVATGYLGRPELTAEKFTALGDRRGYDSGDRARLTRRGDIEFLGRSDQQVKIRGHRVEPGEIEIAIRREPEVQDVALVVRGPAGDRRLDAYLVAAPGARDVGERLRRRLREELPAAMVPSSFTLVDRMPVNGNGKVDPARLPAPGTPAARGSGTPAGRDPVTEEVLAVYRRVLDAPDLAADTDFFDAGGHSLLATRLIHALHEQTGVRLGIQELYRHGTAAGLARLVAERRSPGGTGPGPLALEPDEEVLPDRGLPPSLPPGLRPLAAASPALQKTFVLDTGHPLSAERVRTAAAAVLARHPALRLTFTEGGRIAPGDAASAPVRVLTLPADLPDPAAWLHERAQETPVDPARGPLVRLTAAGPLLALTVHLTVLDGRGLLTLCRTLADALRCPEDGTRPVTDVDDGFLRYLAWRDGLTGGARAKAATRRWRELLRAATDGQGPARPEIGAPAGRRVWAPGRRLHEVLRSVSAELRVTPFLLHLTAFATALAWAGDRAEVCPAVPLDGRCHSALDQSVGGFANIVPVPLRIPAGQPPARTLATVRDAFGKVAAVRTVPYADLAAADELLRAFTDLPVVFHYARDDEEPAPGADRLRGVGPDPLAPGQRVRFTVVDTPTSFRVSFAFAHSALADADERLLTLYQQALYELAFAPDGAAPEAGSADAAGWNTQVLERM